MAREEDIQRLVSLFGRGMATEASEESLSVANMILESNLRPGMQIDSMEELRDATKKHIYRNGGAVEHALEFERLADAFSARKELSYHWRSLYLFYKIASQRNFQYKSCASADEAGEKKSHHSKKESESLLEEGVVREVFYAMQGTGTNLIFLDIANGRIKLDKRLENGVMGEIVTKLVECGLVIGQLKEYVVRKSSVYKNGPVQQGICVVVERYVQHTCSVISAMEQESAGMSIRQVYVQMYQKIRELKKIHAFVLKAYGLCGGTLLSELFDFGKQGDPRLKTLASGFFAEANRRYLEIIHSWISEGHLIDVGGEFFVKKMETEDWSKMFFIDKKEIPVFISAETANKILISGTSQYFCRAARKDVDDEKRVLPEWISRLSSEFSVQELEDIVDGAFSTASKSLLQTLVCDHGLIRHLHAVQKYVLLLSGDFAHALVEHLGEHLSRPTGVFFRNDIVGLLETAIHTSSAGHEEKDIIGRLDVRLMEVDGGTGWESMCLRYQLLFPLDVIISERGVQKYECIFLFLWKIKRAEFVLSRLRSKSRNIDDMDTRFFLFEAGRVISCLSSYVFSTISEEWELFKESIREEKCTIGTLIESHNAYLNSLLAKVVFDEEMSVQVKRILSAPEELKEILSEGGTPRDIAKRFSDDVYNFLCMIELKKEECFRSFYTRLDFDSYYSRNGLIQ
eukprot:GHVN01022688.1.p1 GENE.GHVN01022688.1~~GHVN01022688.1.p1  ORF type:complete len:685 (-),score=75.87 GHVN01022688.1:1042-3096(-)